MQNKKTYKSLILTYAVFMSLFAYADSNWKNSSSYMISNFKNHEVILTKKLIIKPDFTNCLNIDPSSYLQVTLSNFNKKITQFIIIDENSEVLNPIVVSGNNLFEITQRIRLINSGGIHGRVFKFSAMGISGKTVFIQHHKIKVGITHHDYGEYDCR